MAIDADEVAPNLYVGGRPPPGGQVAERFDHLVLADHHYQLPASAFPGVAVTHLPMVSGEGVSVREGIAAARAARQVHELAKEGKRVLITCHHGLDRSAFVAAAALKLGGAKQAAAVAAVRKARGEGALSHPKMLRALRQIA